MCIFSTLCTYNIIYAYIYSYISWCIHIKSYIYKYIYSRWNPMSWPWHICWHQLPPGPGIWRIPVQLRSRSLRPCRATAWFVPCFIRCRSQWCTQRCRMAWYQQPGLRWGQLLVKMGATWAQGCSGYKLVNVGITTSSKIGKQYIYIYRDTYLYSS